MSENEINDMNQENTERLWNMLTSMQLEITSISTKLNHIDVMDVQLKHQKETTDDLVIRVRNVEKSLNTDIGNKAMTDKIFKWITGIGGAILIYMITTGDKLL